MLMIVVFAHTAGLAGAEVGVAGGASALGQKLLEAVFGDQAVRSSRRRPARDLHRAGGAAARRRAPPLRRPARRRSACHEDAGAALRAAVQDVEDAR